MILTPFFPVSDTKIWSRMVKNAHFRHRSGNLSFLFLKYPAADYLALLLPTSNHFCPHPTPLFLLVKRKNSFSGSFFETSCANYLSQTAPDFDSTGCGLAKACSLHLAVAIFASPRQGFDPDSAASKSLFELKLTHANLPGVVEFQIRLGASTMEWVAPQHEEINLNCEVSSYANAEL